MSAKTLLAIVVLAAFTVLVTWRAHVLEVTLEAQSEEPLLVGKIAPAFSALTLDGRSVSLADFRGKKVVVSFWASWCAPCRLEMPILAEFYKKNHVGANDFEILAVSIDEDPKEVMKFASAQKLNFPVLLDSERKIADAYGVDGIPTLFVVDENGKVAYGHAGFDMTLQFQLTRELGIKELKPGEGASDGSAGH
ncbi:MAG TPA: TlpA disulfide reductase family protein [Candidatus Aquilonibacter sp.]|nr:TlpA disulfide reductase family protein [Candidatus Aquilonibacter sp.]